VLPLSSLEYVLLLIPFLFLAHPSGALAASPELSSFFNGWVGSWSGSGSIQSVGFSSQEATYALDFKVAQVSENAFERASVASLWNGEVQQSLMDFELAGSGLKLKKSGESLQEVVILESTPKTLSFVSHAAGDGRNYDLVYRLNLSGDRLSGDVEMDFEGERVSESRFNLMRSAN
jgi:hypothetical protein